MRVLQNAFAPPPPKKKKPHDDHLCGLIGVELEDEISEDAEVAATQKPKNQTTSDHTVVTGKSLCGCVCIV